MYKTVFRKYNATSNIIIVEKKSMEKTINTNKEDTLLAQQLLPYLKEQNNKVGITTLTKIAHLVC